MVFWFDWPVEISDRLNIIGSKTYVVPANTGGCNRVGGGGGGGNSSDSSSDSSSSGGSGR